MHKKVKKYIIASERADLVVTMARCFCIDYCALCRHTVMYYVILNTCKSNFTMHVN